MTSNWYITFIILAILIFAKYYVCTYELEQA
jgi:hypothetical protein